MSDTKSHSPLSVKHLVWNLVMWSSLVLLGISGTMFWRSGYHQAVDSMEDGRRLIIHIATGDIEGKQLEDIRKEKDQADQKAIEDVEATKTVKADIDSSSGKVKKEDPQHNTSEAIKADMGDASTALSDKKATIDSDESESVVSKPKKSTHILNKVKPSAIPIGGVNKKLTQKTNVGLIPRIAKDGTVPWKFYAKKVEYKGDRPVIAVVVTGLGTSKRMTEAANKLPENITLSFSPYTKNAETWATAARITGHEIMLDLPLQPVDYPASDPGPYALLTGVDGQTNEQKLQWLLSRFGAFIGVLTPLNDGFSGDIYALATLMESVAKKGLIFALSRDLVRSEARKMLEESESPVLTADVLLDEDLDVEVMKVRVSELIMRAKERGYALAVARSYPITFKLLHDLPEIVEREGVVLMPVSYIAKSRMAHVRVNAKIKADAEAEDKETGDDDGEEAQNDPQKDEDESKAH